MQAPREPSIRRSEALRAMSGLTLMELLTVLIIVGVLAGLAMVSHNRTLERGRWRAARDVLEAIYAGERVYGVQNSGGGSEVYCAPPATCTWEDVYVDDPAGVVQGVAFSVTAAGGTFTATATRAGGPCPWSLTINEARAPGGGNPTIDTVCP